MTAPPRPPPSSSAPKRDDGYAVESDEILVVDDSPTNLLAIEAALGDLGVPLAKATSGREALRYLLDRDVALILLDVQMPSLDGFETARLIRQRPRTRHVPIIFITAHSQDDQGVLAGYSLGAVDFLFKPIVPAILRAKASVFVELQRRTAEVRRQSQLLREAERREHERTLHEERHRWESEALRQQMEKERRAAEALARKAEELTRTIEDKERAERQLTAMNEQLAEADRRKDEFLAMVAHELRNPLAAVVNSLALLERLPLEDDAMKHARGAMGRQLSHLTRIVDDLLDISRITSGKIELRHERVDLRDAIAQAVSMIQGEVEARQHSLEVSVPDEPLPIDGDLVRLTQVIANLLHNAIRYTDRGGAIELGAEKTGGSALVNIRDNGQGIPSNLQSRVFDVFVQKAPGGPGLGLGLALVKRLTELHGGAVQARSDGEGCGSTFSVSIPLALPGVVEVPEQPSAPSQPPLGADPAGEAPIGPMSIVVIDDTDDLRDTLCALLEALGHQVRAAATGIDGLELLKNDKADVALVDIGMPGMNGYELATRARAELNDSCPRLIAMTGFGQDHDRERALQSGFDAHLTKPASVEALLRAMAGR